MSNLNNLIDELTEEAEPVKVAPRPLFITGSWMLAIVLYIIAFVSSIGLRSDFAEVLAQPIFIIEILIVIATITTAAIAASFGAYPDRVQSKTATILPLLPLSLFIIVIAIQFFLTIGTPAALELGHAKCMGWMCFLSLLPAAGLFLLLSRGLCLTPVTTYRYAALASTMAAYLVLRLEEANVTPLHLILMHITPMLIIIGIAAYIARLPLFSPFTKHDK